jgi:hypothetical protein
MPLNGEEAKGSVRLRPIEISAGQTLFERINGWLLSFSRASGAARPKVSVPSSILRKVSS